MKKELHLPDVVAGCMRLGTWGANLSLSGYQKFIEECLTIGVSTFDHADIYGDYTTEADFGQALKGNSSLRSKIQIVTKCGIQHPCAQRPEYRSKAYNSSAEHISISVEKSLQNFNTDYIDLFLLHRPDYLMNPHEIAETLERLKSEGKILAVGVSNFTPSQFSMLNQFIPLVTNQVQISLSHLFAFEDGTVDQCIQEGIRPMAWSPLAGGSLQSNTELQLVLEKIAKEHNVSSTQVLYGFLAQHPAKISTVTGTTKSYRVAEAVEAQSLKFNRETWYELWQAASGKEIA